MLWCFFVIFCLVASESRSTRWCVQSFFVSEDSFIQMYHIYFVFSWMQFIKVHGDIYVCSSWQEIFAQIENNVSCCHLPLVSICCAPIQLTSDKSFKLRFATRISTIIIQWWLSQLKAMDGFPSEIMLNFCVWFQCSRSRRVVFIALPFKQ